MEEQKVNIQTNNQEPEVIFANIQANDEPVVISSLCPDCEKMGNTTIMLTKIPMFKELIVTSFYCDECGCKNTDVQFGGKIGDFDQEINLKCTTLEDFKRDVVRSEFATVKIPEIEFEIPNNKKGTINTIEGFLSNTIEDLESDQEERKEKIPQVYQQIADFIKKLQEILEGKHFPIHFIIEDPSGNSYIKNAFFPRRDPNLIVKEKVRTIDQYRLMGYNIQNEEEYKKEAEERQKELEEKLSQDEKDIIKEFEENKSRVLAHKTDMSKAFDENSAKEESLTFPINCHVCLREGLNKMCIISVPYFKEITIMSFNCDFCGAKNSDVKVGGGISDQGVKITLEVKGDDDLKRDLFKSETAGVTIPELELELCHGTLGGVYTTVEGLIEKISENLVKNNPYSDSDSGFKSKLNQISEKLEEYREGKTPFTLILEDMCEDSFIQNPLYPKEDTNCVAEKFKRTPEMDDELGVAHMKV